MKYIGCCVELNGINEMVDQSIDISYRTFMKHVKNVAEIFPQYDWSQKPKNLTLKQDCYVSYHRSKYRGKRCYYICHSAIEYIWR